MLSLAQSIGVVRKGEAAARAALSEATAALGTSLGSIMGDDRVIHKSTAVAESVQQFVHYAVRKGVDELVAERAASEAVRKVGLGRKTQSDFREMGPAEQNTRLNRPAMSSAIPHQTRTKPQGPLDEDPDESDYLSDVTGTKPSDARSRAKRPNVRRVAGQEDATAAERTGQDDLAKIALQAKALQAADPSLTGAQAFEKAYLAPANRDLANREFRQRMARLGA
jgi:hypothetical protein